MNNLLGKFVICRSRDQGVVCGYLRSLVPQPGGLACAELDECRQIHGWGLGSANTLFEAAIHGFLTEARISQPLDGFVIFGVCGVYPCSEQAIANLSQSRWNEQYTPSNSARSTKRRG